jgi:hypothetical protein
MHGRVFRVCTYRYSTERMCRRLFHVVTFFNAVSRRALHRYRYVSSAGGCWHEVRIQIAGWELRMSHVHNINTDFLRN